MGWKVPGREMCDLQRWDIQIQFQGEGHWSRTLPTLPWASRRLPTMYQDPDWPNQPFPLFLQVPKSKCFPAELFYKEEGEVKRQTQGSQLPLAKPWLCPYLTARFFFGSKTTVTQKQAHSTDPRAALLSYVLKMKCRVFTNKYSPQQNLTVKKDIILVPTPTRRAFCQTNGKSLAQLTSCDLRSKNDPEPGKQGDVNCWAVSGSLLPPGGQRPKWRGGSSGAGEETEENQS